MRQAPGTRAPIPDRPASPFVRALHPFTAASGPRQWWYLAYDQLHDGLLPAAPPSSLGLVLIESKAKARRRPYHRQKLALVLTNQRHFALEQQERGLAIDYHFEDQGYAAALSKAIRRHGVVHGIEPAERELRQELQPLVDAGHLVLHPHRGWLTTFDDLTASQAGPPYRMDAFYRQVRRRTGLLMERGRPLGGRWSFDTENRRPWRGEPAPPPALRYPVDPITQEVGELIAREFAAHPGTLCLERLPATQADAERTVLAFLAHGLAHFGPYEDAMARGDRTLFHSRLSALLNLHRVLPGPLLERVANADVPLASKEGFVRQVLGWREFVRHVHAATDGFRRTEGSVVDVAAGPGDGGYSGWSGRTWPSSDGDGGARPSFLDAHRPLPPAFWGRPSGLACLDEVVRGVWEEGYSHHITRLMVLANLGTLLDVEPRALTDWFWIAYQDAFDWVVEPNVLGMGTFAAGPVLTTKPYVAGSAYLHKMGDYCEGCAFDPRSTCPVTPLYWAFLGRQRQRLASNPRLKVVLAAEAKRSPERKAQDHATFERTVATLERGEVLSPP